MGIPKGICIYCSKKGKMSKEHVIPTGIVNALKLNNNYIGYQQQKAGYTFNNQTIKTVCQDCNNGILSQLDEYMKKFLLQNFNDKLLLKGKKIQLIYNYHKLSRWLSKIICNSNEINNYSFELKGNFIKKNKDYILGKERNNRNSLYIEVIRDPYLLEIDGYYNYSKQSIKDYKEYSRIIKISNLLTGDNGSLIFLGKMITIGEFIFYLFDKNKYNKKYIESNLANMNIIAKELSPNKNEVELIIGNNTIIDLFSKTYEGENGLNFGKYYQDYKNKNQN